MARNKITKKAKHYPKIRSLKSIKEQMEKGQFIKERTADGLVLLQ